MTDSRLDAWYTDIGTRIQARREAQQLQRQELADAAGLSRMSIANIEAGRQRPPLHRVALIAAALDCDVTDLLPAWDPPGAGEARPRPQLRDSGWVDDVLTGSAEEIQRMRAGTR